MEEPKFKWNLQGEAQLLLNATFTNKEVAGMDTAIFVRGI